MVSTTFDVRTRSCSQRQTPRYDPRQPLPHTQQRQQEKDPPKTPSARFHDARTLNSPFEENSPQSLTVRYPQGPAPVQTDDRVREIGVQTHPGCESDGEVGEDAHEGAGER